MMNEEYIRAYLEAVVKTTKCIFEATGDEELADLHLMAMARNFMKLNEAQWMSWDGGKIAFCSRCGSEYVGASVAYYCPNCGAKMTPGRAKDVPTTKDSV